MLKDHLGDFSCENHLVVSFTKITGELALVLSKNKNKISHLHGPVKFLIFFSSRTNLQLLVKRPSNSTKNSGGGE